jgi:hypothetical protein
VGSEATANAAGRAICERRRRGNILCNESFLGALKFFLEVQSWELTLGTYASPSRLGDRGGGGIRGDRGCGRAHNL